eukprot:scaffold41750_cov300-Skeletonema_dohrnii-CCMP3373.AAC.1
MKNAWRSTSHCCVSYQEKTSLDISPCQALADGDLRALGLSRKASKRFKGLFSTLGQHSTRVLSRISSASDMNESTRKED